MTFAFNHFLYLCSWAGGIFAIGLSLLLLAVIALAGWGWLNATPTSALSEQPQPANAPRGAFAAFWSRLFPQRKRSKLW